MWLLSLVLVAIAVVLLWKTMSQQTESKNPSREHTADTAESHSPEGSVLTENRRSGASNANLLSSSDPSNFSVNSGNTRQDIKEMIKMLNLAAPDAGRLSISADTLLALRSGEPSNTLERKDLNTIADKLRNMLK